MSAGEKRVTLLGVVALEPGESVAFAIPPDLDPDAIRAAIAAAEAEKRAAAARESERLRKMFLKANADG
jgi:hypothetical protein